MTLFEEAAELGSGGLEDGGLGFGQEVAAVSALLMACGGANHGEGVASGRDGAGSPMVAGKKAATSLERQAGGGPHGAKEALGVRALSERSPVAGSNLGL